MVLDWVCFDYLVLPLRFSFGLVLCCYCLLLGFIGCLFGFGFSVAVDLLVVLLCGILGLKWVLRMVIALIVTCVLMYY